MVQTIIIAVLLIISLVYLGRVLLRSFKGNAPCETGCGKCGDIQKSLESFPLKK